jgi:hypothetical protein
MRVAAAYAYWCVGELEEAILLLEEVIKRHEHPDDVFYAVIMLTGIKIKLSTRYTQAIGDQLLCETEELLIHFMKNPSSITSPMTLNRNVLGRIYLRLAEVRAHMKLSAREVNSALRQARPLLAQSRDRAALSYLDRLFPVVKSRG